MPDEGGRAAAGPGASAAQTGLPVEAVEWGFRLLAGRAPVNQAEFDSFKALPDIDAMRRAFTNVADFHGFFSSVLAGYPAYALPLFLLRPPQAANLDWRFEPPDLEQPGSQLCTASQFAGPAFVEIAEAMNLDLAASRKVWEQIWVVAVLATAGLIAPDRQGLGLETNHERIGSLLASRGVQVQASGTPAPKPALAETRRLQLFYPEIINIEDFDRLVSFAELDPRGVGRAGQDAFDFCWSLNMPERLGSIDAALDFFEASLVPLKPGGLALHTLMFNLTSDQFTWDLPGLVILRRSDIERLAERLAAGGHRIVGLNTHPGSEAADEKVKTEATGIPGLRQRHGFVVTTSFGLALRKAG
jgi:hypothetical protein